MPTDDLQSFSARAEPSKRATLERLLSAAKKIFAQKGLAGARMEDIARQAGVTKQLVYHYYGSKESLFTTVLDDSSRQIMDELVALNVENLPPQQALLTLLDCTFEQYMNDPLLGSLALEGIRYHESAHDDQVNSFSGQSPALKAKFASLLQRGISDGIFRADVDARFLLATSALLMSGGFTNHYTLSVLVGFDTRSTEGMKIWREHAANFILAAIIKPC